LTAPQFSYLVRTEPVLRQWVPLAEGGDAVPAALEHRAAVVRRVMARASSGGDDDDDGDGDSSSAPAAAVTAPPSTERVD